MNVTGVYVSVDDPSLAYARVVPTEGDEDDSFATFPFSIVLDEGPPLLHFPPVSFGNNCPFGTTRPTSEEPTFATPTPAPVSPPDPARTRFDLGALATLFDAVLRSARTRGEDDEIDSFLVLETEVLPREILRHYRAELQQPDWNLQSESADDEVAWATWSLQDESHRQWLVTLFTGRINEKLRKVRLWAVTGVAEAGPN